MRYEDLTDEREQEIWREEMAALRGISGAEGWAAHAIERHRQCHSGPMEATKIRRRTIAAKNGVPPEAELRELAARCYKAGRSAVGGLRAHSSRRTWKTRCWTIRAYATLALQLLVGTGVAARALQISEQGLRNRTVYFRTDYQVLADKVRAFAAAVQAERKREGRRRNGRV